jgi:hypothetical protein
MQKRGSVSANGFPSRGRLPHKRQRPFPAPDPAATSSSRLEPGYWLSAALTTPREAGPSSRFRRAINHHDEIVALSKW